jgi:hypothetical protein
MAWQSCVRKKSPSIIKQWNAPHFIVVCFYVKFKKKNTLDPFLCYYGKRCRFSHAAVVGLYTSDFYRLPSFVALCEANEGDCKNSHQKFDNIELPLAIIENSSCTENVKGGINKQSPDSPFISADLSVSPLFSIPSLSSPATLSPRQDSITNPTNSPVFTPSRENKLLVKLTDHNC